jgi:N-acyl-D-aspartate/D-glutamate deacylase
MTYDVIIRNGLWFDGTGTVPQVRTLGIRDGIVAEVSAGPLDETGCTDVIDAVGKWIVPGFIDVHTHYDAEVLLDPGLKESVRHGVTTVLLGNCSLSTVYADSDDAADLFSRVEAVPRKYVLGALETKKTWSTPAEYVRAIDDLPLGPNVSSLLGHSDLRTAVLGLDRPPPAASGQRTLSWTGWRVCSSRRSTPGFSACPEWTRPSTSSTGTATGRAHCRRPSRPGANGAS